MSGPLASKLELLESVHIFVQLGYHLFASHGTAEFLKERGINAEVYMFLKSSRSGVSLNHFMLLPMSEGKITRSSSMVYIFMTRNVNWMGSPELYREAGGGRSTFIVCWTMHNFTR